MAKLSDANQGWWEAQAQSALCRLESISRKDLREVEAMFPSLQSCAESCVSDALVLLVLDYDKEAQLLLDWAAESAKEALRTERFDRIFDQPEQDPAKEFRPSPKQMGIERTAGFYRTSWALHDAIWFRSGIRPLYIWKQSLAWYEEYCQLAFKSYRSVLDSLMIIHIEAEDYDRAKELYREFSTGPLEEPPHDMRFLNSPQHVLYTIAEFVSGNQEYESAAQAGIDHWYRLCRDWVTPPKYECLQTWDGRLSWVYLRGKHFTCTTRIKPLLKDLRGF